MRNFGYIYIKLSSKFESKISSNPDKLFGLIKNEFSKACSAYYKDCVINDSNGLNDSGEYAWSISVDSDEDSLDIIHNLTTAINSDFSDDALDRLIHLLKDYYKIEYPEGLLKQYLDDEPNYYEIFDYIFDNLTINAELCEQDVI